MKPRVQGLRVNPNPTCPEVVPNFIGEPLGDRCQNVAQNSLVHINSEHFRIKLTKRLQCTFDQSCKYKRMPQ